MKKIFDRFDNPFLSRRHFVLGAGIGLAGLALSKPVLAADYPPPSHNDTGTVENGKVKFSNLKQKSEPGGSDVPAPLPPEKRVGFAIVALGRLTVEEILPAFADCKFSKVTALVSGSPEKARLLAEQYGIAQTAVHGYEDFERLKDNPEVQAVYIVLTNAMHRDYTERAAAIGKHVLLEKPMANSAEDCRAMIGACAQANVKLMIAYRCQYEPFNMEVIRRAHDGSLGGIRLIEATNNQNEAVVDQWRLKKAQAGGGALPDIGLYCLNAARYVTKEEPAEVFAWMSSPPGDDRFKEVEATMDFLLKFPSGAVAMCSTSYDAYNTKKLSVRMEKGWMELNGAFAYHGKQLLVSQKERETAVVNDVKLAEKNQFAEEIDHMADCILNKKELRTPGEEGLRDQIIMEALYRSAAEGKPIQLSA